MATTTADLAEIAGDITKAGVVLDALRQQDTIEPARLRWLADGLRAAGGRLAEAADEIAGPARVPMIGPYSGA